MASLNIAQALSLQHKYDKITTPWEQDSGIIGVAVKEGNIDRPYTHVNRTLPRLKPCDHLETLIFSARIRVGNDEPKTSLYVKVACRYLPYKRTLKGNGVIFITADPVVFVNIALFLTDNGVPDSRVRDVFNLFKKDRICLIDIYRHLPVLSEDSRVLGKFSMRWPRKNFLM